MLKAHYTIILSLNSFLLRRLISRATHTGITMSPVCQTPLKHTRPGSSKSSAAEKWNEMKWVMVLMRTVKRGNEGEQDAHWGVVYWAGPQGALRINPSLTQEANHNFKASLCPILAWPWGHSQRQPLGKVSPVDALQMDAVFLSDMLNVRILISLSVHNSQWCPWIL